MQVLSGLKVLRTQTAFLADGYTFVFEINHGESCRNATYLDILCELINMGNVLTAVRGIMDLAQANRNLWEGVKIS